MSRARRTWAVFALAAAAVLAGLAWASAIVVRAETRAARAQADEEHAATVRLALWRLDAWLAGFLAREAARPPGDYDAPPAGDDPSATPLGAFSSEHVACHFAWRADAGLSMPWSRPGDARVRAIEPVLAAALRDGVIARRLDAAARAPAASPLSPPGSLVAVDDEPTEFARRAAAGAQCQAPDEAVAGRVGAFAGTWLGPSERPDTLVIARRVLDEGDRAAIQGYVVHWPSLRAALEGQVRDLLAQARIEPAVGGRDGEAGVAAHHLATLPARLVIAPPEWHAPGVLATAWRRLGGAWLAALVALVAVGVTLRAVLDLGRRRERFAAAVAHELRTPLTSFRLHADLLASGMVADEAEREASLQTLRGESERLGDLVENVLGHARLGEGRARPAPETTTLAALAARLDGLLAQRMSDAGMRLAIAVIGDGARAIRVDVPALSRIVANIADNATKYARGAADAALHVEIALERGRLRLRAWDHGPGIPAHRAASVFTAFDRAGRDASDGQGLGLGLALSREIARGLGGDMKLFTPATGGAGFEVEVGAA